MVVGHKAVVPWARCAARGCVESVGRRVHKVGAAPAVDVNVDKAGQDIPALSVNPDRVLRAGAVDFGDLSVPEQHGTVPGKPPAGRP